MPSLPSLIELRHALHARPEVSGNEQATAALIANRLRSLQPAGLLTGLGGHGVLATFDSGQPGPALLFRCELDALPIAELNEFPHRSCLAGVSHKCGHDGHMAILCGLAETLASVPLTRGRAYLLFQPAEETGEGAEAVLRDPAFANVRPDQGFALHNFPGVPRCAVFVRNGTFTAAVGSLILRYHGRTSHASEPEHGLNPSLAVAELLHAADARNLSQPDSPDFRLVTPIHVRVGTPAYGVSAGHGEVHLTLRCWDDERLERLYDSVRAEARTIATRHGLVLTHETLQRFRATVNDPAATEHVRRAARHVGLPLVEASSPAKAGEDFGLFTARFPCCLFGLGAGEGTSPLHSPDYDFPDALIEDGVRLLEAIARDATAD